jgi:hypothetical protein
MRTAGPTQPSNERGINNHPRDNSIDNTAVPSDTPARSASPNQRTINTAGLPPQQAGQQTPDDASLRPQQALPPGTAGQVVRHESLVVVTPLPAAVPAESNGSAPANTARPG